MRLRGEEVRIDDTPDVLSKRLASYRAQTEPLVHYYSEKRKLITVDGMMTIGSVTSAINRVLDYLGVAYPEPAKKTSKPSGKKSGKAAKKASSKSKSGAKRTAKKAPKKAGAKKKASKAKKARKPAKKTAKKRR
jgi:adenylate kinase